MTLGEQIRQRRKSLGITQEKLSIMTGIKRQHLTRLENGITKNPSIDTLSKLSVALQYNLFNYLEVETFDTPEEFVKRREELLLGNDNNSYETVTIKYGSHESQLLSHFKKLNVVGEKKALEQVEMLTKIPEYQRNINHIDE